MWNTNKRPVFKRYLIMAAALTLILAVALTSNNLIMINNLNQSLRERTEGMVDNGVRYIDDRVQLHAVNATNVAMDSSVRALADMNPRINDFFFYERALTLISNLGLLRDTGSEIADVLVFFDNLDVFFTPDGAWNHVFKSLWEQSTEYNLDLSWIESNVRTVIFSTEDHVVFYNNFQSGVHVFLLVYKDVLELMLAQLISEEYGAFMAIGRGDYADGLILTNRAAVPENESDIIVINSGVFTYQFYYNPQAVRALITTMTVMSFGIAVFIIAATIFVLYKIKRRLYDPLGNIMQLMEDEQDDHSGEHRSEVRDEFAIIEEAIDLMRANLDRMNENQRSLTFNQVISAQDEEELYARMEMRTRYYCSLTVLFEDKSGKKDVARTKSFAVAAKAFNNYPVYAISKYSMYFFFLEDESAYRDLITWAKTFSENGRFFQCGFSSLYAKPADMRSALEESIKCFHEVPTQGLNLQKSIVVPSDILQQGGCRIASEHHIRLISDVATGNINRIKYNLLDILHENDWANAIAKRQLLLCLYDTICMLASNGNTDPESEPSDRLFYENIFNLQLLFDKLCMDVEARLGAVSNDREMLKWVDDNLHRDISLSDLADAMGMSYSYSGLVFKNMAGLTFVEYLQKKRVEWSMKLLTETETNIEEIAATAGFASVNTFFRVFKKYAGVTPGAYREIAREKQTP
jgi:AraC-like DNA-binding protein